MAWKTREAILRFMGLNFSKVKFSQAISVKFTLKVMQCPENFLSSDLKETLVGRLAAATNGLFNVNRWAIREFGIGAVNPTSGFLVNASVNGCENVGNFSAGFSELFECHGIYSA